MNAPDINDLANRLATVLAYHQRSKHSLQKYATGPEVLDWDSQPDPWRVFAGAPTLPLPFSGNALAASWADLQASGSLPPQPFSEAAIGWLLQHAFAITAWKTTGVDTWALRANPSSGNLHPTEIYLLAESVPGLTNGLYHYDSREHQLEQRCTLPDSTSPASLIIGFSSIHWREAWKYGERAFRYCQLDMGHALGALRYAAALLGWRMTVLPQAGYNKLARLLGLDRENDYKGVEREDAECLVMLHADTGAPLPDLAALQAELDQATWQGQANRLDPHPMYRWPVIDEVAHASRPVDEDFPTNQPAAFPTPLPQPTPDASPLLLTRRSAQAFDRTATLPLESLLRLLDLQLPRADHIPWDSWPWPTHVNTLLFVHRVDGLTPGMYMLVRHPDQLNKLKHSLKDDLLWQPVEEAGALPLYRLAEGDARSVARTLGCHQAIASDCTVAMAFLAEFSEPLNQAPWHYRQLYQEAGLLGHVLYLAAEAEGYRATGIGCYFDDSMHEMLGIVAQQYQSLYHFTVGRPLLDSRITTLPAYPQK